MGIAIESYSPARIEAVRAFNQRLTAGGCAFRFPEHCESTWLPKSEGETLYEEFFLAVDGDAVRGGYILKHQPFWVAGENTSIGSLYLPLSEGTVNPEHGKVGLQLLLSALKKQPLLYSLGMGGFHNPYPQMLKAAGWKLFALPFHFLVLNGRSFCRNITFLRHKPALRTGLDIAATTGLGHVAFQIIHGLWRQKPLRGATVNAELVNEFGSWADDLWAGDKSAYALVAARDSAALRRLYPSTKEKFLKLKVTAGGKVLGWAVMLDTTMKEHKQFGAMRVGSIIDCFAQSGDEHAVIHAAADCLAQRGVDLVVSNHAHRTWNSAFDRAGFLRGPSNFLFAASPRLAVKMGPWETRHSHAHMTRGDGEGPSHL
jgi:hypothetical protein